MSDKYTKKKKCQIVNNLSLLRMKKNYTIKNLIVDSQLWVSLMGTIFSVFFMLAHSAFLWPTTLLIFLTFLSGYLYTKYQNLSRFQKTIFIFYIVSFFVCAYLIIANHHSERLFKWLIIVLLGIFYNSSFLDFCARKIPLLKAFYVGFTWALVSGWLFFENLNFPYFSIAFLFISALVIVFDIRDYKNDTVLTFPELIGEQKTKYLAYTLIFISSILASYYLPQEYALSYYLTTVPTFLLIHLSNNTRNDIFYSFYLESCVGLPFLFLVLLKYF